MGEVDDVRLLEQARNGDEDAFAELFARHQRAIYRYATYMCGPDAGDDVVQETFLVVLRQRNRHDSPRCAVIAYLLGVARRLARTRLQGESFLEELGHSLDANAAAAPPIALDDLMRVETIDEVRAAVQSLPAVYREVTILCELQEMDYASAADALQCPIGTVRSRLHRARQLLRAKLAGVQPDCAGAEGLKNAGVWTH